MSDPLPILRGERVWLRPLEGRDLEADRAGVNDRAVGDPAGYKMPLGETQAARWLEQRQRRTEAGEGYYFAVCELGDDRFAGTTWLHHLDRLSGNGELAIYMDRQHIGSGWGTDAARAVLDFGFGELRLERIWLDVYADNARAIRSYEKLGFVRETRLRHAVWHRGAYRDALIMGLLRDAWAAQERPKAWELV
jgi:Acetyltransferases, including N-acetylases of ribosomal proteins